MTHLEAIIFDYGSVLVGPLDETSFEIKLTELAREYGFEYGQALWNHIYISDEWEQAKRGIISHEAFWAARLATLGLTTEQQRYDFKSRLYQGWGLRPAMRALLDDLHIQYQLAILSNTARKGFREYLAERRGLVGLFDVVVSSAEEGIPKPDPEIYWRTLSRLDIASEQALFIDDLERNTKAAEALGIQVIVFTTPAALRAELQARDVL